MVRQPRRGGRSGYVRLTRAGASALLAALVCAPQAAWAQAYQCRLPTGPVSVPAVTADGPVRQRPITGYTLAISWSPEYCRGREGRAGDSRQCSGRGGRFGMVVHGLWPEGRGGDWPQWCAVRRRPSGAELASNLCVTPSAALLAGEWAKHGSCMTRQPAVYFRQMRQLWGALDWPDFDRLSRQRNLTAGDVRRAISDVNQALDPEQIGVLINERGWLTELRLCYDRAFERIRCDARRIGARDSTAVKIWRGI